MALEDQILTRLDQAKDEHLELKAMVAKLDEKVSEIKEVDIPDMRIEIATIKGRWQASTFLIPLLISIAFQFLGC